MSGRAVYTAYGNSAAKSLLLHGDNTASSVKTLPSHTYNTASNTG